MKTTVTRRYHFEAAHWLPGVRDGHKCKRMHGHNYEMELTVTDGIGTSVSGVDEVTGFIIDFWDLDALVQPILNLVDHRTLNDIKGLENPTAENIAAWFFYSVALAIQPDIKLVRVRIYETKDCWADVELVQ